VTVTDRVRVPGGSATVGGAAADRGLRIVGLGAVIAGAFGALVPFFGPLIGLNTGMAKAWEMTAGRAVEHLIPGLVGLAGGVLLLRARRRLAESGAGSGSVMAAAIVVLAAGVWFIIGPDAWPVIHGASGAG